MPESTQELIGWIIGVAFVNFSALILSIITWVKAAKMMPREVKGADLNNASKEISIADQYDELATKAANRAVKTQERLDKIESDYDALKEKVDSQETIIKEQAKVIKSQSERIDAQDEEIAWLKCELENAKTYNDALIAQMKEKNILPIESSTIKTFKDCKKKKGKDV